MTAGIEVAPFQWTVVQLAGSSAVRCSGSAVEGIPDRGSGRPDLAATRSPQKPAQARGAAASGGHPLQRAKENKLTEARGSGALLEFGSVVEAVRCALDVQRIILARNAGLPQDRRIDLRIGVNLGDVIVAPDDIYGHGVNIAARLESLAPPGGICISADVWRHVRGAIAADFVDLGEQRLKNIADPAHVFAVSLAA
jgi:class 3 adenylate cyclase